MNTATLDLACALIARPSVTPADEGCQALIGARLHNLGFTVIGRCVEGQGVAIRLLGEPVELTGWEHFGGRGQADLR